MAIIDSMTLVRGLFRSLKLSMISAFALPRPRSPKFLPVIIIFAVMSVGLPSVMVPVEAFGACCDTDDQCDNYSCPVAVVFANASDV